MAGSGKKTFTSGEVLTASDVNGYLMDQAVMRFASSAARGSAIAAPSEGMVTYLDDSNRLEVYNGSAWTGVSSTFAMSAQIVAPPGFQLAPGSATVIAISHPAGRYTQPPVLTASAYGTSVSTNYSFLNVTVASNSTAIANFLITNTAPASGAGGTVDFYDWGFTVHGIQMTAGSASG